MPSTNAMALPLSAPVEPLVEQRSIGQLTRDMARLREDAWCEFHARYTDRLLAYATTLHRGQRATAEDTVQSGMLRAVRHIRRFDSEDAFWSWLTLLLRCAAADEGRKLAAGSRLRDALAKEADALLPRSGRAGPQTIFVLLDEALEELSTSERNLLKAKYVEGRSTAELAEAQQTTPKTIENRLRRLRKQVQRRIRALSKITQA